MQQGTEKSEKYTIEFLKAEHYGEKWADPLMGWTATSDPLQQVKLRFENLEDAVAYCKKYGFTYQVENPIEESVKGKSYAQKFKFKKENEDPWN